MLNLAKDTDLELPIVLAGLCGLRRGECLGLKVDDINFENNTIKINKQLVVINNEIKISTPKTADSERIISAPVEVFNIIKEQININKRNKALLKMNMRIMDLLFVKQMASHIIRGHLLITLTIS